MTVPSEINRAGPFNGNGVTKVFPFDFRVLSAEHVRVILRNNESGTESNLINGTDYTVSGVRNDSGGSVELVTAPVAGRSVTILRNVPFTQETDLENQGAYYAETVEEALDLAAMRDQQLREEVDRAVKLPPGMEGNTELSAELSDGIIRLADSADNIDTVAANLGTIDTVSENISDVVNVSNNMQVIQDASGSVADFIDASYVGDGMNSSFTLPAYASSEESVFLWVGGVRQTTSEYTVNGPSITLTDPPGAGVAVDVRVSSMVSMSDVRAEADRAVAARIAADASSDEAWNSRVGAAAARDAAQTAQAGAETARTGAQTARDAAQTARTGAETARTGAESARDAAQTARTGAETAKTGAEAARDAAQTARTGAETARAGAEAARDASKLAAAEVHPSRITSDYWRNNLDGAPMSSVLAPHITFNPAGYAVLNTGSPSNMHVVPQVGTKIVPGGVYETTVVARAPAAAASSLRGLVRMLDGEYVGVDPMWTGVLDASINNTWTVARFRWTAPNPLPSGAVMIRAGVYVVGPTLPAPVSVLSIRTEQVKEFKHSSPGRVYASDYPVPETGDVTASINQMIADLPAGGGIIELGPRNYQIGALNYLGKSVKFIGVGTKINNAHRPVSLLAPYEFYSTDINRLLVSNGPASPGDGNYRDNYRLANYTGGNSGTLDWIEQWSVDIEATVGAAGQRKAEKAGLFRVINKSANANGIALMCRAEARSTGAVWNLESSTSSYVSPVVNAHRAAEFAITGSGGDPNGLRWIVDVVSHSELSGGVGNAYDPAVLIDRGVYINAGTADMMDGLVINGAQNNGAKIRRDDIAITSKANNQIHATCVDGIGTARIGSTKQSGELGRFIVHGKNTAGTEIAYSNDTVLPTNGTAGNESAQRKVMVMSGGTMTEVARFQGGLSNGVYLMLGGQLRQVQVGAPDSGGAGYRALIVPN